MSEPTSPAPRRYSGWQIAMLVIGAILLLPGLCSLAFLVVMFNDLLRGNTIVQAIVPLWIISFAISAGGVALIYVARKGARAGAGRSDGSPTS
jgi:hypothetical protein